MTDISTICMDYDFDWLVNIRKENGKKVSQGFMNVIRSLGRCACGSDFCFAGLHELHRRTGLHERTIEKHISLAKQLGLIAYAFNEKLQRWGYFFLKHPVIEAWREVKEGKKASSSPVKKDMLAAPSDRQKKGDSPVASIIGRSIENPPPSPSTETVQATTQRERDHEQEHQPKNTSRKEAPVRKVQLHHPTDGSHDSDSQLCGNSRCTGSCQRDISRCPDGGSGQSLIEDSRWKTAQDLLCNKYPDHILWWKPIVGLQTTIGLQLDCPDQYFQAWVKEKLSSQIAESLQQVGISEFSFSFGAKEKLLQRKKIQAQQQHQEAQDACLNRLSPRQQFDVLLQAYPRKSAYGGDYFAWMTFERMQKRGKLPEITTLLQILRTHKASADWSRDSGRWIPGLNKWLRAQAWWEKTDGEKR